ncbi:MAG: sulfotransferase domain-containing protein [Gammaproteobacteria bacterium]
MSATAVTAPSAATRLRYRFHAARRGWSSLGLFRHRHCDGFIVSMHQSGTHWLKFMLASALARRHGVPPPRFNHANDLIGGVRDPVLYPQIPRLVSSHTIAHPLLAGDVVRRLIALPRYVVLVRDLRAMLVSNYEKWKTRYGCTFSAYLAGDPTSNRFNSDLWWCLRFMNAWGEVAARQPRTTLVLRYEDLKADPAAGLRGVRDFLGLDLGDDHLDAGVAAATKANMGRLHDPERIGGEVREDERDPRLWFTDADEAFLAAACRRLLRHRFGYDYGS